MNAILCTNRKARTMSRLTKEKAVTSLSYPTVVRFRPLSGFSEAMHANKINTIPLEIHPTICEQYEHICTINHTVLKEKCIKSVCTKEN